MDEGERDTLLLVMALNEALVMTALASLVGAQMGDVLRRRSEETRLLVEKITNAAVAKALQTPGPEDRG